MVRVTFTDRTGFIGCIESDNGVTAASMIGTLIEAGEVASIKNVFGATDDVQAYLDAVPAFYPAKPI